MRSVNYRDDVLFPVAHLLGIDPYQDLNKDHARAWNSFANSQVNKGVDFWPWRQMEVTEERAFRTIWKATRPVALFDEIFYLPTFLYYKAIATPPDGTLPTDTNYYEQITLTDFYIALDQPGRRPIGEVLGVWAGNPRTCTPIPLDFRPSEKGIDVGQPHGLTVFVKYKFRPSKFSVEEYNAATSYARRAVVYWTDGDCYEALQPVTGHSPAELAYWRKVLMPELLADFVKYSVAADAAEDLQAVARFKTDAQDAIEGEAGRLAEQGQKSFYNGRNSGRCSVGYYSYGVWGTSPPFAPDATTTTLTDADDPFAEEGETMFDDGITPIINGEAFVDVTLSPSWPGSSVYSFLELQVKNIIDAPPLEIWPTTLVSQTGTGFRILLNAAPDNDNYSLKWRIAL